MASIDPTVLVLLLLLLVIALVSLLLTARHRLAFRIAMRNVRRARSRTILVILGLLIATTIISGSLVTGDTVDQLVVHYTVLAIGYNDEVVTNMSHPGIYSPFPYGVFTSLSAATASDRSIAGMAPEILSVVQIFDRSSGVPQTNLNLIGVNANQSTELGSFLSDAGPTVVGPAPGEVLLDDLAASELNASAGNTLLLYGVGATPIPSVVQAVVQDNIRGAFPTGGAGDFGSVFVDLATAQHLENMTGMVNFISVTNVGDQANRIALAGGVSATLNASLAKIPDTQSLSVQELLVNNLATANSAGSSLVTLFLVLGLFSIIAGAMLIVGIFILLAEERKGEMGMLRAIGLQRGDLVYTYYFEGLAYAAGSALAGTLLGVGVGYGLTYAFSSLFAEPGITASAVLQSFTVNPDSLVIAYVVGFLLTLLTVVVASRRAAQLNIVRAIRDLPEPPPSVRAYTFLAYIGAAALLLGALLYATTYRGTVDVSDPVIGGSLAILGAGLLASRFVRNRIAFTGVGLGFLTWAGFEPLHRLLLGSSHSGGVFDFFVEGILMVVGALLLYAFNSSTLVALLLRIAGGRTQRAPVARIGLSYPGRRPTRTTISLAIFSLVVFVLVGTAGVGSSVQASLNTTLHDQSGGYSFFGASRAPIPNLPELIEANASVAPYYSAVVPLISGTVNVNVSGFAGNPFVDTVYSAPLGEAPEADFYSTNQFTFGGTWQGESAATVMDQLAENRSVAIVDESYSETQVSLGGSSGGAHPMLNPGGSMVVIDPLNGNHTTVTVIGIMSQSIVTGVWINPATAASLGFDQQTAFYLTLSPGASATKAAQVTKAAFFPYGLVLINIEEALASSIASTEGIIGLLQIFVGLGLVVGVAAMGLVAVRAVVERKREIGMIRANGFTERMVLKAFLLEYSFVSLLGIGIGCGLGLLVVWNLTQSPSAAAVGAASFAIPWTNILIILVIAYGLAMAAVVEPSIRGARLPPAEAVRISE